jgi:hypothetical protein
VSDLLRTLLLGLGMLALFLLTLELAYRLGRRANARSAGASSGQVGAVQGATLGLLGLLLAFSFGAAGARFLERQDLITEEANAIGTAYLRADLLNEDHRAQLQDALKRYTEHRIEVSKRLRSGIDAAALEEIARFHDEIWDAARRGVEARPEATLALLNPVNDVIDLHSLRLAAGMKHLPVLVLCILFGSSVLSLGVIGYGGGLAGQRGTALTVSLAVLITAALWITIDLDHPRAGIMRLNDGPLKSLPFVETAP